MARGGGRLRADCAAAESCPAGRADILHAAGVRQRELLDRPSWLCGSDRDRAGAGGPAAGPHEKDPLAHRHPPERRGGAEPDCRRNSCIPQRHTDSPHDSRDVSAAACLPGGAGPVLDLYPAEKSTHGLCGDRADSDDPGRTGFSAEHIPVRPYAAVFSDRHADGFPDRSCFRDRLCDRSVLPGGKACAEDGSSGLPDSGVQRSLHRERICPKCAVLLCPVSLRRDGSL